jgi:hypothetical protein
MLPPAKGLSRTPLFFPPHAHGIFVYLMILSPTVALFASRLKRVEPSGSSHTFSNPELLSAQQFNAGIGQTVVYSETGDYS